MITHQLAGAGASGHHRGSARVSHTGSSQSSSLRRRCSACRRRRRRRRRRCCCVMSLVVVVLRRKSRPTTLIPPAWTTLPSRAASIPRRPCQQLDVLRRGAVGTCGLVGLQHGRREHQHRHLRRGRRCQLHGGDHRCRGALPPLPWMRVHRPRRVRHGHRAVCLSPFLRKRGM